MHAVESSVLALVEMAASRRVIATCLLVKQARCDSAG